MVQRFWRVKMGKIWTGFDGNIGDSRSVEKVGYY